MVQVGEVPSVPDCCPVGCVALVQPLKNRISSVFLKKSYRTKTNSSKTFIPVPNQDRTEREKAADTTFYYYYQLFKKYS
jgi:hypothetical protein